MLSGALEACTEHTIQVAPPPAHQQQESLSPDLQLYSAKHAHIMKGTVTALPPHVS